MRQWDVVLVPYPSAELPHHVVIVSPTWVCDTADIATLNGLVCYTNRPPDRPPRSHEILLDSADGFERKTVCRCHRVLEFARDKVLATTGRVTAPRQEAIKRRFRDVFGF